MESPYFGFLIGAVVIVLFFYHKLTKNLDYWTKRHVVGPKPMLLFGNFKDVMLGKISIADFFKKIYDAYPNEPAVGIFVRTTPTLLLRDPEMIKEVLIKSFEDFGSRGVNIHEDIEPLGQHLVFLEYERWKPLRKTLTPVFSSGKLKDMFYLINECADHFKDYLERQVAKGEPIECRELTAKYTTDVIGVCVFGLNMNAMSEEDSEFRRIGRKVFANSWQNKLRLGIRNLPHWIAMFFKPIARDNETIDFFVNTIKETMKYRKENGVRRNDFVDLLMNIKDHPEKVGMQEMSDILMTAQAFVFFLAGFETSSTTMSNAMYELALNPDIQNNLRKELNDVFKNNNDKLDYESVKNMKYLDKIFKETLRKYPPVSTLPRIARNDHTFEESGISITKNTRILIPAYAIHHDPEIYPNPEKFDPERFDEEISSSRHHMHYLPFGDGPRNCIGERFAKNQTKLGLAVAVKYFKFEICDKTCVSYEIRKNSALLAPRDGLTLTIKKI